MEYRLSFTGLRRRYILTAYVIVLIVLLCTNEIMTVDGKRVSFRSEYDYYYLLYLNRVRVYSAFHEEHLCIYYVPIPVM